MSKGRVCSGGFDKLNHRKRVVPEPVEGCRRALSLPTFFVEDAFAAPLIKRSLIFHRHAGPLARGALSCGWWYLPGLCFYQQSDNQFSLIPNPQSPFPIPQSLFPNPSILQSDNLTSNNPLGRCHPIPLRARSNFAAPIQITEVFSIDMPDRWPGVLPHRILCGINGFSFPIFMG